MSVTLQAVAARARRPLAALGGWIEANPRAALVGFLAIHALLWTALPALLYPNLPLDLIEALLYGREWQLGYDKLPPLPWWMVEIVYRSFGADLFYYLLAQAAVVVALALVYATALPLVGASGALAAILIVDGLHYLNYTAAKFNHDVIQLPFWALAGFALHRALRDGRMLHWLLFGFAIGASLWAKYFVVVLAAPLGLFLLLDPSARRSLATRGPYLAAALALAIMAPHLIWLARNDFLPFAYAESRAVPSRGLIDHAWRPLQFALGQLAFMLPALGIAVPLWWPRPERIKAARDFDYRIVTVLAFGPFAAVLLMAAVSGRGTVARWGYPLWLFLGLWLVMTARAVLDAERLGRIAAGWAVVTAVLAIAFAVNYTLLPRFDHRYRAAFYPGERLAAEMAQRFRAQTGRPLAYVVADMWTGGNIAHYAAEHPRVLIDGEPRRAPWIDLADLKARGAIVVWSDADPTRVPGKLAAAVPEAKVQPPLTLPFRKGRRSLEVGWAIVTPAASAGPNASLP